MKKKKNTLLWKISSAESETFPSYLFGTMHAAPASILPKILNLKPFLEKCEVFAAETDINRAQEVAEAVSFLKDTNLRILLGKKRFEKMRTTFLKSYKIDLLRFMDMNPLFINSFLAKMAFGDTDLIAPDELLWNMANELKMTTVGLETPEQEIEIIRKIPMKYQLNSLRSIAKSTSNYRRKLLKMSELYAEEKLAKLYKSSMKGTGGMKKLLLYDRNEIMANTFMDISKEKPLFAAVGAAHLPGKKGLIKLLKNKGFKVKPVKILKE